MLKNLKISMKIGLLSFVLLLFIGIVGFSGFYYNQKANKELTNMYNFQLLPILWTSEMRAQVRATEGDMLYAILNAGNTSAQKAYLDDIDTRSKKFDEAWNNYNNSELEDFEIKLFPILQKNLDTYRSLRQRVLELAVAGKQEEAIALLSSNKAAIDDVTANLRDLAAFNENFAEQANAQNDKDNRLAEILLISIISIAIIFGILFSLIIVKGIISPVNRLSKELATLAQNGGDLTQRIDINSKDEIGGLANSMNEFLQNLRNIISNVIAEATNAGLKVGTVHQYMVQLNGDMEDISATTEELSAGMEETASSTEEMNATSTEIESAVEAIATKAQEGAIVAGEINDRANTLKATAINSQRTAHDIRSEVDVKLRSAIEQSKAVQQIDVLTSAILSITDQTNLLALNAAIEAARAGEAGKGFAVVANEIRKLAEDSKITAGKIQDITKIVIGSVENLVDSSMHVLDFVDNKVVKDYEMLVQTGEQYSNDADTVDNLVTDFSATSEELLATIQNMMKAINEITSATNEGAQGITNIAQKSISVVEKTNEVSKETNSAKESSTKLIEIVSKFKV